MRTGLCAVPRRRDFLEPPAAVIARLIARSFVSLRLGLVLATLLFPAMTT